MNVLVGCECSGVVREAFRERGHNAWSCDLKAAEDGSECHIQGDVLDVILFPTLQLCGTEHWDLLIAHPPCPYLCVTANKWFRDQPPRKSGALVGPERRAAREKAAEFFMSLARAPVPRICLENPVGVMSTRWRKPDQVIQPYEYGHPEPKKTCLWLKNLPKLTPTKMVEPEYFTTKSGKRMPAWSHKSPPHEGRATMRSRTFPGIAAAMAEQWGDLT